jgi:aminoglycoside phosphotransferase (APT) family kinase protein
VKRLDPDSVVTMIRAAGGPSLSVVGLLAGGAVGAWIVRWPDGHEAVLTDHPGARAGPGSVDVDRVATAIALMDAARAAGVPAPRYEARFELANGSVAVVQERARGVPVVAVSEPLVEAMLELADRRVHGVPAALDREPLPLFLRGDGPGFCLHGPLRDHSAATRDLLRRVEAVGATVADPSGDDIVHCDYHLGNVLVDEGDPDTITAIVDWGGARAGPIALDLVMLAFDLGWRSAPLSTQVVERLRASTSDALFDALWAHASLRLVDWAIRHHPDDVDHWVAFARQHL